MHYVLGVAKRMGVAGYLDMTLYERKSQIPSALTLILTLPIATGCRVLVGKERHPASVAFLKSSIEAWIHPIEECRFDE